MKIQLKNTGILAMLLLLVVSCNTTPDPPAPNPAVGQGVVIGEDPGQPKISRVDLGDVEGNQVRQGHGNLILDIEGKNLANINQSWIELSQADMPLGAQKTIPLTILHKADTQAQLQAEVQHGALTGSYILVMVEGNKVGKKYDAMAVTAITSSPSGDDVGGMGTPDSPFRSLTKAVSLATSADKIFLESGNYDNANGEVFPLDVSGMNISGSGASYTHLRMVNPSVNPCLEVLAGKADTRVSSLGIRSCVQEGIRLYGSKTYLKGVAVSDSQTNGLRLLGSAQANLEDSFFLDNLGYGIMAGESAQLVLYGKTDKNGVYGNGLGGLYLTGNAKVTGQEFYLFDNGQGIRINGAGVEVSLDGVSLVQIGYPVAIGPSILIENSHTVDLRKVKVSEGNSHCIKVVGNTHFTLTDSELKLCHGDGIHVDVSASEIAELKLSGVDIKDNDESGIEFRSDNPASKLTMTSSKLRNNGTYGLYMAGVSSTIVLGSNFKPGNNIFSDNGSTYLADARSAGSGSVAAMGNTFATAGLVTPISGLKIGPASQLPFWQIVNAGNTINFGSP